MVYIYIYKNQQTSLGGTPLYKTAIHSELLTNFGGAIPASRGLLYSLNIV